MPPPPGMGPGRYFGRLKSFNPRHGYGFIDCPEARSRYGRDVFIHKARIGDLEVGMDITFSVELNKDNMPQSRDILRMDGRPPGKTPPHLLEAGKGSKGSDNEGDGKPGGGKGTGRPRRRGGKARKNKKGNTAEEGDAASGNGEF